MEGSDNTEGRELPIKLVAAGSAAVEGCAGAGLRVGAALRYEASEPQSQSLVTALAAELGGEGANCSLGEVEYGTLLAPCV